METWQNTLQMLMLVYLRVSYVGNRMSLELSHNIEESKF